MKPYELKPCPFCGKMDYLTAQAINGGKWEPFVECNKCGSCSAPYNTQEEAIEAWNRRVK